MEDWQKGFFEMLEEATHEVEQFFLEITEEAIEAVDAFFELSFEISEEITAQVQNTFVNELDRFLNDLVEPVFDVYLELEQLEFTDQPEQFVHYVEPTSQKHPACMGCRNYHGHVYGGNLLVCGMHPSGWDDETCPDWESH